MLYVSIIMITLRAMFEHERIMFGIMDEQKSKMDAEWISNVLTKTNMLISSKTKS